VKRERREIRQLIRTPYPPLAEVLVAHPYVARQLKHLHRPRRYIRCPLTVKSNPPHLPDLYVFGIYVVDIAEVARKERGEKHDALIVQDFLVIQRQGGGRIELYSGGSGKARNLDAFCRRFKGPRGDGYGCYFDGTTWLSKDHHPTVLPHEGRFRAAMNATMRTARERARNGDFE
jgi:hypothetical protein